MLKSYWDRTEVVMGGWLTGFVYAVVLVGWVSRLLRPQVSGHSSRMTAHRIVQTQKGTFPVDSALFFNMKATTIVIVIFEQ